MKLAIINTVILLGSSGTWIVASKNASNAKSSAFRKWTLVTMVLGVLFLISQIVLWKILITKGFTAQSSIVGSVFYMLTGVHGVHIIAGLAALVWIVVKVKQDNLELNQGRVKLVGLFWHFLDILWICLFIAIFLI